MPTRAEILAEAERRRGAPLVPAPATGPSKRAEILAEAERRRAAAGALPLPVASLPSPEFAPIPTEFERTAAEAEAAAKATQQRLELSSGAALEQERRRLEAQRPRRRWPRGRRSQSQSRLRSLRRSSGPPGSESWSPSPPEALQEPLRA
jgi:hypothetical protein